MNMFDLMDTTQDRAIIQVISLGSKTQSLCRYIARMRVEGVDCFVQEKVLISNSVLLKPSLNVPLEIALEQGSDHHIIEAPELNFYLIDGSELAKHADLIRHYMNKTCLNCLVLVNQNSIIENGSEKLEDLIKQIDSYLALPNSSLRDDNNLYLSNQHEMVYGFIRGISEIITRPGLICIDFTDVRTVMAKMGKSVVGVFSSSGENRINDVLKEISLYHALQNNILSRSSSLLVNMTVGKDILFREYEDVVNYFQNHCEDNISIIIGTVIEIEMQGDICMTVVFGQGK